MPTEPRDRPFRSTPPAAGPDPDQPPLLIPTPRLGFEHPGADRTRHDRCGDSPRFRFPDFIQRPQHPLAKPLLVGWVRQVFGHTPAEWFGSSGIFCT